MPNYQKGTYDALYDIVGVLSEMQTSIEDHNLWLSRITDQLFDIKDELALLNKSIKERSPDPDPAPDPDPYIFAEMEDIANSSDEQLGNYFNEVQNGNGYYDDNGKFHFYSSER